MRRLFILLCLFVMFSETTRGQDTLTLDGQPNWKKGLDIANYCLFFEETRNTALSFEEVKKQPFVFYGKPFRIQKFSNRPLIIQWLQFIIHNTSAKDTLVLKISTIHYFTRLYNDTQLIARSGAYEEKKNRGITNAFDRGRLPIVVPPNTITRYWLRTEDRQSQLIPPQIKLETTFNAMDEELRSNYAARYLFLILAAMVGCFFFIGIYACYHYYLYRDTAFLWYICYSIAGFFSGLHWMDIRLGMGMFSPLIHDIIFSIFLYLTPILYSFFIGGMLQLPVYFKKGWLLVKILVVVCIIQMLLQFTEVRFGWFPFNPDYYGNFLSIIPLMLLNIVLLILTAKSKNPVKWFLFTGICSLLILWCLPILNLYAPSTDMNYELFLVINFPVAFLLLGLTIEAICFSFALSYRSKLVLLEKIDMEQKIAETELTALRAQMNPHFIFNCLNSIKLYTLENDSQTASAYLTKFSQLIRLVLENSRSEKVSLQKEMETLTLYIELEAMRFKTKVRYQIQIAPQIDQQYIEIPPLLLQPYVENAIWHGLMHKPEGGNIIINVLQPSEDLLHIEIEDDGIGRKLAMEHKSKSATKQKSFGLKMTSERLAAINHIYKTHTEVNIIDLTDAAGNSRGTKVIIEIPL